MNIVLKSNLRTLRGLSRLTQRKIAAKLEVSPSAYGNYETGYARPTYEILYKISRVYGIAVDDLLFRSLNESALSGDGKIREQKMPQVPGLKDQELSSVLSAGATRLAAAEQFSAQGEQA